MKGVPSVHGPCLWSLPATPPRPAVSNRHISLAAAIARMVACLSCFIAFALPAGAASAPEQYEFIESLRKTATKYITPLPEQMPGSELDNPEMIALGRKLFTDKRLSVNNTISCSTCHSLEQGRAGVDNEPTSAGAHGQRGTRNTPTVLNAGWHLAQFWDGRSSNLVTQAREPILNPIEMAMPNEEAVLTRIREDADYSALFQKAFPKNSIPISFENLTQAIAAFERTLRTRDRFDDFLNGDQNALSVRELRGLDKFMTWSCRNCHKGPLLGGNDYQKMGLFRPYENVDVGRKAVTNDPDDEYRFKVPSLRNVALTAPYFHDGSAKTLEEAVRKMGWHQGGLEIPEEDISDIAAFLHALTDKARDPNRNVRTVAEK